MDNNKQSTLIDNTQEQKKKKLRTAIAIEKRKNDLFQYTDREGMTDFVVLLAGFFLEAEREFPECFGLSITKKSIKEDKEYKPQFIKLRKEEDVKSLTLDKIPISGMTAYLLFGYYDALRARDMSLFKIKVETFLLSLEQRYVRKYIIKFIKEVKAQFKEYVYNHDRSGIDEAKSIFEIKLKEHNLEG